ncbi:protein-glutamate O-methyltransferase CheR [Fibrisoma montanum]|uniref:Protein-glutamate O-methyltransferase CheR n=1 Tax=Fibrisoma montanum TaxID=2305895 RepID=A0A418M2G0_9BACT|nr:protein-glutamate O-methyltransferase CheR [Fibrisoma montanum]RIV19864.1 protein-glutamate O-methyltransferase CheR [Fibrisoma montanum]
MMNLTQITNGEIDEIISVIRHNYGYDFGDYARASFHRRVVRCMDQAGIQSFFDLRYALTNDQTFFSWFLQNLTVNVTEMFRDPVFYKSLRTTVIPILASYPTIKIWHAGCATGEEVFSMAILLHEAGLLERTRLYGTDLNPANLERARQGIVPMQHMKDYTANYLQSGGQSDFSTYYTARYDHAIFHKELRRNIVFSQHNLVTDQVFNEFQLVCCRNVLIYFNRRLQNQVCRLLTDSLAPLGYLAIGMKESLMFTDVRQQFDVVDAVCRIYRRKT